jgi:hypothetical protein
MDKACRKYRLGDNAYEIWLEILKGRDQSENINVDERTILK